MGTGVGRRYDARTSSPMDAELVDWGGSGDAGEMGEGGGSLEADRLLDDLLRWERPPGELRRPSSDTGDAGPLPELPLLEVPLSRALL